MHELGEWLIFFIGLMVVVICLQLYAVGKLTLDLTPDKGMVLSVGATIIIGLLIRLLRRR